MTDSNIVNLPTTEARWYDSFINLLAGLGVMGRDKFAHQQYSFSLMTVLEQENAYRGDWLARKAVQIPAWDMTREWRNWQADPDQIKLLEAAERKLFLQQRIQEALIKARLYGGAVMVIGVDAGKPEDELDLETVTLDSLKFLHVVSKNNIATGPIVYDITSKYYGQPEYYEARTQPVSKDFDQKQEAGSKGSAFNKNVNVRLHPSRVVKLIGVDTADQQIANVWGDSVLQPVNDAIKACGLVSGSLATLCSELKIDVIKIPELKSILSTDAGTRKMLGRFEAANVAKSTVNTILIDGNEEWQRIQASLAGVPEIIATYMQVVSGAVDIPAGRFLGLPHRGLNVTGEADFRNYYDRLASEQSVTLQPAITVLDEVLIRSALGDRPEEIFYEWNSLWQLSDGDKADIGLKKAQAYQIDVNAAQLPPTALANARANQLIEDGFYPGLEQALEDAAAEGDTIEEQNQPAPMPMMGVDPATGQPMDPNAPPGNGGSVLPFPPKKPKSPQPGQTGQLPANARRSTAPGMKGSGDSADRPFDSNECHDPHSGEFCGAGSDNPEEVLPPEPGTAPIPEGHVRLYHQTSAESLGYIREHGIELAKAKGIEGPKAIYADPKGFYGAPDQVPTVEFHVPRDRWDAPFVRADSELDQGKVAPENIIGLHYPWHAHARYIENNPEVKRAVLAGEHEDLLNDPQYGKAIQHIQHKYRTRKDAAGNECHAEAGQPTETHSQSDYNECHDPNTGEFCGEGGGAGGSEGNVAGFIPGQHAAGVGKELKPTKQGWYDQSPHRNIPDAVKGAHEAQGRLGPIGERIAKAAGAEWHDPGAKSDLVRIKEKADERGGVHNVSDLFRGGFTVDRPEQADKIAKALAKEYGTANEHWKTTDVGYTDKAISIRDRKGMVGEIQVVERGMAKAKKSMEKGGGGGHDLYKQGQELDRSIREGKSSDPARDRAKINELDQKQRDLYGGVIKKYGGGWKRAIKP